jgi:hypothetical protein
LFSVKDIGMLWRLYSGQKSRKAEYPKSGWSVLRK